MYSAYQHLTAPLQKCSSHSFVSCGHYVHQRCFCELMGNRSQVWMENDTSSFCPVCRRVVNAGLPVIVQTQVNRKWREIEFGDSFFGPASYSECWIRFYHKIRPRIESYMAVRFLEFLFSSRRSGPRRRLRSSLSAKA